MMNYDLVRYEKYKDKDGNITSIFLSFSIYDEEDRLIHEYWLTKEEVLSVLENEDNIVKIMEEQIAEGMKKLEKYKSEKPIPPEIADDKEKRELISQVSPLKILSLKKEKEKKKEEEKYEREN